MTGPVRVFVGYDPRQPLAYNVLQSSLHRHSTQRIIVEPLILEKLPIKRRGLTEFTFSRFLVPWLCEFNGAAIFMDADVVVTGDISELADCADEKSAVQVMKEQERYEWASVMLFNCDRCKVLTPEYVDDPSHQLLDLSWASRVGSFPKEWNHCVGYAQPMPAKLYHFTQGIPCWPETHGLFDQPFYEDRFWLEERDEMLYTCTWAELMSKSVHAKPVIQRMLANYGIAVA